MQNNCSNGNLTHSSSFLLLHDTTTYFSRDQHGLFGAQILAFIAFFISLAGWWLPWISGLTSLIILAIGCSVSLPAVVWYGVAVLSAIASVGELLVAIHIVGNNLYCSKSDCGLDDTLTTILAIAALIMWALVSLLTLRSARNTSKAGNTAETELPR